MKHSFTEEIGELTYCGDHYCTGHKDEFIVCSCGWKIKDFTSAVDDPHWGQIAKIEHILKTEGLMG